MDLMSRFRKDAENKIKKAEQNAALSALMADLRYVISRDGSVIDLMGLQPAIAWHLTRCGFRPDPDRRVIKARRVVGRGVPISAVEYVDVNEPDRPEDLADLPSMTMAEINALPKDLKAKALRRMGGPETDDLPENPGWHVQTSLKIEDAPDPEPDRPWSR